MTTTSANFANTVSTGLLLVSQSGATAFSLNSRPPGVGLELSVDGMHVNSITRPVAEDVLAQQPKLKRNQQLGQGLLSGLQIDSRLLINRFLDLVPLTGLGLLYYKVGKVTCKDLLDNSCIGDIRENIEFLFGRWVVIQIISPRATPDRNFLTLFDAETHELLDCVEIVCNNKYCVMNKISISKFNSGGYLAFKICAHIDMDAMYADKEYLVWFHEHGFPLDNNGGLYGDLVIDYKRRLGGDHSTPSQLPQKTQKTQKTLNSRWDAQVFYINPDFKFRQIELPRLELPYSVFNHGFINLKLMKPELGNNKLFVEIIANECGKLIIYDYLPVFAHLPTSETPYQFVNKIIDVNAQGIIYKTNDRYFLTFEKTRDKEYNQYGYTIYIKSYDIRDPTKVVNELKSNDALFTNSSEKCILHMDGRIEIPMNLYQINRQKIGFKKYKEFNYLDSQGSELVIFDSFTHQKTTTNNDGRELGYQLEVINNLGNYTVSAGNIYKWALLKRLSVTNGIFITGKLYSRLNTPKLKEIKYSPDGRFIAMLFNSEETDAACFNMQGVLVFEKTLRTQKWHEIGYVNFPDSNRYFGVNFQKADDERGYALIVSNGSKSGTDLVYLPNALSLKYYSRLTQGNGVLGLNNMIDKNISAFLSYNRFAYQDLGYGISNNKTFCKEVKNKRGFQKPFINMKNHVIQVD